MKLNDSKAILMLKRARLYEVDESISSYPEDERDGRSDFQMLADEAGYIYSLYSEDTAHREDLTAAREKLNRTKYGKCIPVNPKTFKPLYGYTPYDISNAKDTVNEFARLGRFVKRLEAMGYYSRW